MLARRGISARTGSSIAIRANVPLRSRTVVARSSEGERQPVSEVTPQAQAVVQETPSSSSSSSSSSSPGRGIAAVSAVMAATAFAASRLLFGGPSLAMMEQESVPLDVALQNNKPTVLEFYADWCEVCRSLVAVEYALSSEFKNEVNFVMLNVDNSKWAPELNEYRVGGIPHFVFLSPDNTPLAATVGKLPTEVLAGNVGALAKGQELPYARARGAVSDRADAPEPKRQTQPRDHA